MCFIMSISSFLRSYNFHLCGGVSFGVLLGGKWGGGDVCAGVSFGGVWGWGHSKMLIIMPKSFIRRLCRK